MELHASIRYLYPVFRIRILWFRVRIQNFRLYTIRIEGLDDQNLKNFYFTLYKMAIFLSLGIHKGRPQENIQHSKP